MNTLEKLAALKIPNSDYDAAVGLNVGIDLAIDVVAADMKKLTAELKELGKVEAIITRITGDGK